MATHDISRSAFSPRKHYSGVRMQQGRVLTDDDFNEAERIHNEDRRRTRLDVIGTWGSPDDGFRISGATDADNKIDFAIGAGTMYLGGLRLEMEESETFRSQSDWLWNPGFAPPIGSKPRTDLVYLEAWQQPVSAVEDDELHEKALGGSGPDTSSRVRTTRRVRVHSVRSRDCAGAWKELIAHLEGEGLGTPDEAHLFESGAKLKVTFDGDRNPRDLCTPRVTGGYLGADNQTIRVQVVDPNHITWGFDNASPLYRVTVEADTKTIHLLTEPKDDFHRPKAGDVVEILRPGASLANGELIAEELEGGHHTTVVSVDDSDKPKLITLKDAVQFNGALSGPRVPPPRRFPAADYSFMRIWRRGNEADSLAKLPISLPGVLLGTTGIRVHIDGNPRPGDYWVISVRPETPDTVVPWNFEDTGRPPHGPHRYIAPLALIHWRGQPFPGKIVDCRRTFKPLTNLRKCCIPVAPGEEIQRAIDILKREGGGCICLLPGDHHLATTVDFGGCSNIRMEGFGRATRLLVAPETGGPAFLLHGCDQITFTSIAVINTSSEPVWSCSACVGLTLEKVSVFALFGRAVAAPAIGITGTRCENWSITSSTFIAPKGIEGPRLTGAEIHDSLFIGSIAGVKVSDLFRARLMGCRLLGIDINAALKQVDAPITQFLASEWVDANQPALALERLLRYLVSSLDGLPAGTNYSGLDLASILDVSISSSEFRANICVESEVVDNVRVTGCQLRCSQYGLNLGATRGFTFERNIVTGVGESGVTGVRLHGDAGRCLFSQCRFSGLSEGIVFESDYRGYREIADKLKAINVSGSYSEPVKIAEEVKTAEKRVQAKAAGRKYTEADFHRIGNVHRINVRNSEFKTTKTGIRCSGTKVVGTATISGNTFTRCQGVSIHLEPDAALASYPIRPAQTDRLIKGNSFDVFGPAIRSTIGEVRLENNIINVQFPELRLPPKDVLEIAAKEFVKDDSLIAAANESNAPRTRVAFEATKSSLETGVGTIDYNNLAVKSKETIVNTFGTEISDEPMYNLGTISAVAAAFSYPILVELMVDLFSFATTNLEGFAVNIDGQNNTIFENRIRSNNANIFGGVLVHSPAVWVTANDIKVPRIGVMVSASESKKRRETRIESNRVVVSGLPEGKGKLITTHALAIPTLTPGDLSILDNHFEGSVMVGADVYPSLLAYSDEFLVNEPVTEKYNNLSFSQYNYVQSFTHYDTEILSLATTVGELAIAAVAEAEKASQFNWEPHKQRSIILFAENRVIRGWSVIVPSTAGVHWSPEDLKENARKLPIIDMNGNVFDYWALVVGLNAIIVGNRSQKAIQYRVLTDEGLAHAANLPAPKPF